MSSARTQDPDSVSSSETLSLSASTQHPAGSSNEAAMHPDDGAANSSQSQKLTEMQAEEMERVKRGYEEHEEKFGNRE